MVFMGGSYSGSKAQGRGNRVDLVDHLNIILGGGRGGLNSTTTRAIKQLCLRLECLAVACHRIALEVHADQDLEVVGGEAGPRITEGPLRTPE